MPHPQTSAPRRCRCRICGYRSPARRSHRRCHHRLRWSSPHLAGSVGSTSRRRPLRLLRRRRPATLKALTLSPNRDRRLRQPRSPRSAHRLGRRPRLRSVRRRMPGSRTRCPGHRRRARSCQRVAARQATRRLPSRRARSLTSPTRCRPRRSSGHRRALTLRNAGRRGRTFGLPARHAPGMSRSKRS